MEFIYLIWDMFITCSPSLGLCQVTWASEYFSRPLDLITAWYHVKINYWNQIPSKKNWNLTMGVPFKLQPYRTRSFNSTKSKKLVLFDFNFYIAKHIHMELNLSKWFHPLPFSIAKHIWYAQVQLGFTDFNFVVLNKYIMMHLRYEQVQLARFHWL